MDGKIVIGLNNFRILTQSQLDSNLIRFAINIIPILSPHYFHITPPNISQKFRCQSFLSLLSAQKFPKYHDIIESISIKNARAKTIDNVEDNMAKDAGKIKLTTRQILLYLSDVMVAAFEPFDANRLYRKSINEYFSWRSIDKKRFNDDLRRLEREGIVKFYHQNNQDLIELSHKGKEKVKLILAKDYQFQYPEIWDQKWRIVIFDIPNKKKGNRDIFRNKLKEIGFLCLQESVFVFPFDCKEMVDYFKNLFNIEEFVLYIIADTVETQIDLLNHFIQKQIIKKSMLDIY